MTAITSRARESTDSLLRFAMRADAVLTGLAGVIALPLATQMSSLSGLSVGTERALSVFFIAYGLVVFGLAALRSVRTPGIAVIIANIAYTVAAIAVVVADVWPLTATGVVMTLASGVYTAFFAYLQYLGVRRLPA